ncbi:hypothetical protein HLB44_36415 [Aquincola sp. S2]|uniref:Type III secretion protein HrpB2 n=1 Tax=Pseudaquabacterium terrae TaxID=2732868 RepID=A0ABX2EUU3_9BURK|nr:hypothetical protein [Aquabacterium terrae]NRF72448.1 hypothetical protein [Aquabacterium terrae]
MIEAVSAIAPAASATGVGTPTTPSSNLTSLSESFNRLMAKDPDPSAYSAQNLHNSESAVTKFIGQQEKTLQGTFDQVRALTKEAPMMDAQELAARHIEMSYQMSMVQVQFNAGVYIAQSGKTGLQTLMKNQ